MLRITPTDGGAPGTPVEYPDRTPYRFDPDPYEPGMEQFVIVAAPGGEVSYSLWTHLFESDI